MRIISPDVKAALAQPHYQFILFHLGGVNDYYLTNAPVNISHNGHEYLANGLLLDAPPIKEQADLKSGEIEFTFADMAREFSDILEFEGYLNRPVYAEKAIIGNDFIFKGTLPYFAGTVRNIERASIQEQKRPPLTIQAQWIWAAGETPAGRNCSEGSQKAFFPNDQGMGFINDLGVELPWGRA